MYDTKFITNILNIPDDRIQDIKAVPADAGALSFFIRLKQDNTLCCPLCGNSVKVHGYSNRTLTHSTFINRPCTIIYRQRRYFCSKCEHSFSEQNPFSSKRTKFTYETLINVLTDLKYCANTYTAIARRCKLTPTQVQRITDKHLNIPRKPLPEVLSLDEHYFPTSNFDSLYICILMDFRTGVIIDVLPDRKKAYISSYFNDIRNKTFDRTTGISELNNVKYISMDLYDNYRELANIYFPKAICCADSFHVLEHLTNAFKKVRLRCLKSTTDKNIEWIFHKFRYIFSHNYNLDNEPKYNKRFSRYMNLRDIINILFERFPDLEKAYELKEAYIDFNETANLDNAPEKLSELIDRFYNSNIPEYEEFYNLLINWNKEIINSFTFINGKRVNNSYIESRNRQIETLMFNANGFVNFTRTRNRILYCLNKDDTYTI